MGQLELLAAPAALSTWEDMLQGRQVIHFVDNDSAAANLVRGYSPKQDSYQLVGEYWTLAARAGTDLYIDRVESKSNLADGPNRLEFSLMRCMGANKCTPRVRFIFSWGPFSQPRWLGHNQT